MLSLNEHLPVFAAAFILSAAAAVTAKRLNHAAYAVLKPMPVLLLIAGVFLQIRSGGAYWQWMIGAGLLCGMCGDLLLLDLKRFFIPGLAIFLLGNLCYCASFISGGGDFQPAALLLVIPCGVWFSNLRRHIAGKKKLKVIPALFVYLAVLIVMCGGALSFDIVRGGIPFFTLGAVLFMMSDSMLAWNVFVRRTPVRDVLVSVTYYTAQASIAAGAAAAFPPIDAMK